MLEKLKRKVIRIFQLCLFHFFYALKYPKRTFKKILRWILATWPRRLLASFLIILFIITPLSFLLTRNKAEAAWWNDSWAYRKSIQITNNTTAETNVYVSLTLDTSDTTRFQSDCGDLRFTQALGKVMPYYIYSGCGTASTVVYVNFDTFQAGQQAIYEYYGNPNAADGFSALAGSGNVTQANMRLSIVNGTAFADFSSANTLTPYLGDKVVISDSASKKLTGYIKAAGTGETYGSEMLTGDNANFESTTGSWWASGATAAVVSGGQSGNCMEVTTTTNWGGYGIGKATASGGLYRTSAYIKAGTATSYFQIYQSASPYTQYSYASNSGDWAQKILYGVAKDTSTNIKISATTSGVGLTARGDSVSFTQVLTPSTTGVTITDTAGGTNYNWASEETGFNRNDAGNYTYKIYPSQFSTEASNYTIGAFGAEEKTTGPVAYWALDEGYGTTAYDATANHNDGTISNATWKQESDCVSGKCLGFDGSTSYVQAAENKNLPAYANAAYTVSGWVKGAASQLGKTIFGEGKSTDTTASGSVTQANMKLSIVNGTAFADFSSAGKLTPYIGNKIVITDSSGTHHLTGYIKAAGSGETYGSELLKNTAFDNTSNVSGYNSATISSVGGGQSGNSLQMQNSGATWGGAWVTADAASSGALLSASVYVKFGTTNNITLGFEQNQSPYSTYDLLSISSASSWTPEHYYGTATADTMWLIAKLKCTNGSDKTGFIDTASVAQVLTPSTTGVTITDTAGGTNYNWASEDSGFNRNDSGNYTYTIYPPQFTIGTDSSASGKLRVYTQNDNGTQPLGASGTLSTSTVFDNNWHHIEWVDANGTATLYVDGKADATNFNYTKGTATLDRTSIGAFLNATAGNFFNGSIDEMKVYSYARTSAQVKNDYDSMIRGSNDGTATALGGASEKWMTNGLVGQWKMDESSGTVVADASGNGNTGTLTNAQETNTTMTGSSTTTVADTNNANLSATDNVYNGMILSMTGASCNVIGQQRQISAYTASTKTITVSSAFSAIPSTTNCTYTILHQTGGKFGNGVGFDNTNDYVNVHDADSLDVNNNITISAWINFRTDANHAIVSKGYGSATSNYNFYVVSRALRLERGNGSAGSITCTGDVNTLNLSTWYFVAVTYNGSTCNLYINNSLHKSISDQNGLSGTNGTDLKVGQYVSGSMTWDGQLDDVRIYNRALSPNEVSKLYNYAPGPVGWWKMDEKVSGDNKTLYDASGNSNNGTTHYGANTAGMDCTVPGKFGTACQFDGVDDYADLGDASSLNPRSAMSLCAWVNTSNPTANSIMIANKDGTGGGGSVQQYTLRFSGTTGKIQFRVAQPPAPVANSITGNTVLAANKWYNVCGTFDGSVSNLYINGIADATPVTQALIMADNSSSLILGNRIGDSYYYPGKIDDVRVYNYARTQEQILEDMSAQGGSASGGERLQKPVAYYNFNEGYGATAHNSGVAGSALDATLYSGGSGTNDTETKMWDNGGKFGKAVEFDGTNDYVSVPDTDNVNDFNYNQDFSVSTWVKIPATQTDTGGTNNSIMEKWAGSGGYAYVFRVSNQTDPTVANRGKIFVSRYDGTNNPIITSTVALNDNNWHHLVFSRSSSNLYLYIDGKQNGTTADTTTATSTNASSLYIGERGGDIRRFTGLVDELKIYNYGLTPDDIKADYDRGAALAMGSDASRNNNGTTVTGAAKDYCIPGDTTQCDAPKMDLKMDERTGTTAYDTSGNGNDATQSNSNYMPTWAQGKQGSALHFDGTNDVIYASHKAYFTQAPFTAEAWVKFDTLPTVKGSIETVIDKKCSADPWDDWEIFGDMSNQINFMVANGSKTKSYLQADGYITAGIWYHVVATLDSSYNMNLFINGVKQSITRSPGSIYTSDDVLNIGGEAAGSNNLTGSVDGVRFYNYVRTPSQIAWDYNRGLPVAAWRFNECQGNTVHDESGNGNNGTINLGGSGQTAMGTCTDNANTPWYNGRVGKYGASVNLDGVSDYVNVPDNPNLDLNLTQFSASFWFKLNSQADYVYILSKKPDSGAGSYAFRLDTSTPNHKIYFVLWSDSDMDSITTDAGIINGQWYHVVGTWDNAHIRLYINGVLQSRVPGVSGTHIVDSAYNLTFGLASNLIAPYMDGQIDDAKIFNYALTAVQVKTLYNNSSAVQF